MRVTTESPDAETPDRTHPRGPAAVVSITAIGPESVALAYNVHKPFLGWAADIQDPYDVITGSGESLMGGSDQFAEDTGGFDQARSVRRV